MARLKLKLSREQVFSLVKPLFWDYKINADDVYALLTAKKKSAGSFNFERIFIRMLERLPWYDLIDIFGMDNLRKLLTSEMIDKIHNKELKQSYEYIGRLLHGEAVSFTGWSFASRKRIKNTLLSNRWYSFK